MAEENQTQVTPEAKPGEQAQADSSAATENTESNSQEQNVPYARFKEVNEKLRKLEADAAKKAKADADEDERRKAEQGEWQKLYEGSKGKVEELAPKAQLADKLSAMVLEQYEAEIKEWPEQVRNMAPADDANILTKLDWMKRAKPLATELLADKVAIPGNGRRPQPVAAAGAGQREQQARSEQGNWTRKQV